MEVFHLYLQRQPIGFCSVHFARIQTQRSLIPGDKILPISFLNPDSGTCELTKLAATLGASPP